MTREQVYAVHKLYRRGHSVPQLAQLLWRKFGYSSAAACQTSLYEMFASYKFKMRTPNEGKYASRGCKGCGGALNDRKRGCHTCSSRHSKRKSEVKRTSEATSSA